MGMAADEFFAYFRSHVIEIETPCFLGNLRMIREWWVCSASQGQPWGARRRFMMAMRRCI